MRLPKSKRAPTCHYYSPTYVDGRWGGECKAPRDAPTRLPYRCNHFLNGINGCPSFSPDTATAPERKEHYVKLGDILHIGHESFEAVVSPCPGSCIRGRIGSPEGECDLYRLNLMQAGCKSRKAPCIDHTANRDSPGYWLHFKQITTPAVEPNPL